MLWPSLSAWHFALAGLGCATIPFVIHLLNRRRFRVVDWAAMDFLREAIRKNRRILHLRDLLLLALRTLAVLMFGLALARPYLSSSNEKFDGSQPLHAVLIIDNSLSMGYQLDNERLLDRALRRSREFVDKLPKGSRISVIPLCGSTFLTGSDPFDTKDGAMDALRRIALVDRSASVQRALNEAKRACEVLPELAKRVVFLGDQQRSTWNDLPQMSALDGLPPVQVVDLGPNSWENSWISDLRLQDGLADTETPATFLVEIQHRGRASRKDVLVTLRVDDVVVGAKTVTLEPSEGARQVAFEFQFTAVRPEPGRAEFVPVRAALSSDRLGEDDERFLMAPVVAALPVVFVDQYAPQDEDPLRQRLGETRHLRKLLSPVTSRKTAATQLVAIRHLRIQDLSQERLADARLVVIAGIERPADKVSLLREYVEQGGQLVIAAGGSFDPVAWTADAWLEGAGILPAPLRPELLGALPEEAGERLQPFFIAYDSMAADEIFQLPETSSEELRDLYEQPFFFQAVDVDVSDPIVATVRANESRRLLEQISQAISNQARQSQFTRPDGAGDAGDDIGAVGGAGNFDPNGPQWLLWSQPEDWAALASLADDQPSSRERLAARVNQWLPRTLARFTRIDTPFLVERRIRAGKVMFVASGVLSSWNTLPKTDTMFLFDRMLRGMIESTLPRRNFATQERIQLALPTEDRGLTIRVQRPDLSNMPETHAVGYIGTQQSGLTIDHPFQRGLYHLDAQRAASALSDEEHPTGSDPSAKAAWKLGLAVNGPAEESDLTRLGPQRIDDVSSSGRIRWLGADEEISLAGAQIRGQSFWWYLILLVLVSLLAELVILGWSQWRNRAIAVASP